jgi:hypothetical protein
MAAPDSAKSAASARLGAIRESIRVACARAGRDPEAITLVGAGKTHSVATLRAIFDAGLRDFGENRVQEGQQKAAELPESIRWHLLGPLQTNKVKAAVGLFDVFHAIDRDKVARSIDREAAERGIEVEGFLEVNLGDEASKHGFAAAGLAGEAAPLAELRHLRIVGLMAIPPLGPDPEASRPWFRRLAALGDELATRPEWRDHGFRGLLSMGMSADFEVAIEEGATHVRVGTALFGAR